MNRLLISLAAAFAACLAGAAEPVDAAWLQAELETAREQNDLVSLGAVIAEVGEAPIVAVSGETARNSGTPVSAADAWHIGSNTKALTALLYARLVEDGLAEWGAALPELFPVFAEEMDPAWQDTTMVDLFAHRSGIGQLGPVWLITRRADNSPLPEQRLKTARARLTAPPQGEPGTFEYSNLNYIIAGAAIEQLLELSWEEAITAYVFDANGSDWSEGWGFGPPQEGVQGHTSNLLGWRSPAGRGASADNPQALGPAGTAHAPLESHARLLLQFLDEDSSLITPAMRHHLLHPWPDQTADYAMGWGVGRHETMGRIYTHAGSNTMWLSRVMLIPGEDTVVIVNASEYTAASRKATGALIDQITARLAEPEE